MQDDLPNYRYAGARAMVILHERHLRGFLAAWRRAKNANLALPETDHPDYVSLETLLRHVFGAACGYLFWFCEVLGLPDPEIRRAPGVESIEALADEYLDHLTRQWRSPLANIPEEQFETPEYESYWKTKYCLDAMLEHAVMHPIRHEFQLQELLKRQPV